MKKSTVNFLALMFATAFLASGCNGLKQMAQNSNLITREITPNPLEMHGGKVPVSIKVTFPPKYFDKKAYIMVTPAVKSQLSQDVINMSTKTLQGEGIKDNNNTISYKLGGEYTYQDVIDFSDPYRRSDLILNMKANKNGETETIADVKIGDGINATPLLVEMGVKADNEVLSGADTKAGSASTGKGSAMTIECKVEKPKSSISTKDLTMYYQLQQSSLDSREMKKKDVKDFIDLLKEAAGDENSVIKAIEVASYASPDGPENVNQQLVDQRGKSGEKFAKDQLKKVSGAGDIISRQTTQAEDWEGFKKSIEASNIKDKDLILRVLSMYSDPTTREREIKNIAAAYTALKSSVLPQLRRSEIKATIQTKEKTDSELADLAKSNFDALTQEEAIYAATMPSLSNSQKIEILKKYTEKYPQDWRGFNNLGVAYMNDGKLSDAQTQFNKARGVDSKQPALNNNLGVVELCNGNFDNAKENFARAKNVGCNEAGYNMGVLNIRDGEYEKAIANFGSAPSFNKALAQVLAKNVDDAKRTLNSINSQDAIVDYLKAIIGSRQNEETQAMDNLKKAVDKDPNLKNWAKYDVEFLRYFESDTFRNIVD